MSPADVEVAPSMPMDSADIARSPRPPETVFSVLAMQARRRTAGELRTTALGCAVNAGLLLWQHPTLSGLASAFIAASAYGAWGVADGALTRESNKENADPGSVKFLRGFRATFAGAGVGAAIYAAYKFMAAALAGWHH